MDSTGVSGRPESLITRFALAGRLSVPDDLKQRKIAKIQHEEKPDLPDATPEFSPIW